MKVSKRELIENLKNIKKIKRDLLDNNIDIKSMIIDASKNQYLNELTKIGPKIDLEKWDIDQLIKKMLPRIDIDNINFYESEIIKAIYKNLRDNQKYIELQIKYIPILDEMKESIEFILENNSNPIFNLFKSKEIKGKLIERKNYLELNENQLEVVNKSLLEITQHEINNSDVKDDFLLRPSDYYEEMAKSLGIIKNQEDPILIKINSKVDIIKQRLKMIDKNLLEESIQNHWQKLIEEKVEAEIDSLSISYLMTNSEISLPADFFYEHDIRTVKNLKSFIKQTNRHGQLSPNTIEKLAFIVAKFTEQYQENYYPRINSKYINDTEFKLLHEIYHYNLLQGQTNDLVDTLHHTIVKITDLITDFSNIRKNNFEEVQLPQDQFIKIQTIKDQIFDLFLILIENEENIPEVKPVDKDKIKVDFNNNAASYYSIIDKVTGATNSYRPNDLPNFVVDKVKKFNLSLDNLAVTLRPYQEFGAKYGLTFKKTLLGDEMGLGKTIQALAIINHLYVNQQKYSIVIAPLSVLANWEREVKKWTKLPVYLYRQNKRNQAYKSWVKSGGILLLNFEHAKFLNEIEDLNEIDCVIIDEAHVIKNPNTQRSIYCNDLANKAEYNLFMTGTPLENRLSEMEQLIKTLNPSLARQLELDNTRYNIDKFKKEVSLVYLRRKRDEVLRELPAIETIEMWSNMSNVERDYYNDAVMAGQSGLMRMRRAAFYGRHPKKSEKIQQIIDICNEARENGDKVIIFSFFKIVLNELKNHLGDQVSGMISGEVSVSQRQDLIDEFTESNNKSIILCQIDAGGVGLNIQAANIVILCEPQWKPSVEHQAVGRVYRMGQTKTVIVYRLLSEESIDESMLTLLGQKEDIFNTYAHDSAVSDAFDQRQNKENINEKDLQKKVIELELERLEKNNNSV